MLESSINTHASKYTNFMFQSHLRFYWQEIYACELEVLELEDPTRELEIFFPKFETRSSISS